MRALRFYVLSCTTPLLQPLIHTVSHDTPLSNPLTISVICPTSTPSQDIVGIRLHRPSIILPLSEPSRVEVGVSVFRDGDLRKSVDCGVE